MPIIDHIDGPNRRIYLHADTVGVDLEPMDIYKEMRTLRQNNEELRKYDCFLAGEGKVPKKPGSFTERYVVCLLGTRIVPYDATQILTVIGTIITDDGQEGTACFDKSLLTITTTVDIHYQPPQVEVIELGDPQEVATAVWSDANEYAEQSKGGQVDHLRHLQYSLVFNQTYVPGDGEVPDGSQHRPFNDVAAIIDYAELHKIKNIFLYSELIPPLGQNVKNFVFSGVGLRKVVLEDQDLTGSEFHHIELEGQYLGRIIAENCFLTGTNTTVSGEFGNCTFGSSFEVPNNGSALIQHSSSVADGFVKPTFSIGGVAGTARLEFAGHVGGITIINCNQPTDDVKIIGNGIVELDSSCQDGDIVVVGLIAPIDNSGPGCNVQWLNLDPTKLSNIPADVWNHTQ